MAALMANRQFNIMNITKTKHAEKLSSGYRINRAADDAAGLAISEKMRREIRGLSQGSANIQDGISLCQVADGYLHEVQDMIQRINELAVKGANDTLTDEDRSYLNEENKAIKNEMARIFDSATFNEEFIFHVPYMPEVTPDPEPYDIQVFYSANGVIGGLEFNNIRYNIEELKAQGVKLDSNGIATTDQEVSFKLKYEPDEEVTLKLSAGDTLADVKRNYKWTADSQGIKINNVRAATWEDLGISTSGANSAGTKSFNFRGMNVKFDVNEGDTITAIMDGINGDSFTTPSTWDISAAGATSVSTAAITSGSTTHVRVTNANKNDVNDEYEIVATGNGLSIKNVTDGTSTSETAWANLSSDGFRIVDWGEDIDDNSASQRSYDNDTTYHYQSPNTNVPIGYNFKLANAASKTEIINSLNGRKITGQIVCPTSTTSSNAALQISNKRIDGNNDAAFALQNAYGRDFDSSQSSGSTALSGNITWTKTVVQGKPADSSMTPSQTNAEEISHTNESTSEDKYYKVQDGAGYKYYKITETTNTRIGNCRYYLDYNWTETYHIEYNGSLGTANMQTVDGGNVSMNVSRRDTVDFRRVSINKVYTDKTEMTADEIVAAGLDPSTMAITEESNLPSGTVPVQPVDRPAQVTTGNTVVSNGTYSKSGAFVKTGETDASNYAFTFSHSMSYQQLYDTTDGGTGSSTITTKSLGEAYRNLTPTQDGARVNDYDFLNIKVNPPEKHCIIQCAPDVGDPYEIDIKWSPLNLSIAAISGADLSSASRSLSTIAIAKESLNVISEVRSTFGSYQNRLDHARKYNDNTVENTQASESRIRDTEMAHGISDYSNAEILAQAGQMMIAQANQTPQGVLSLLQ